MKFQDTKSLQALISASNKTKEEIETILYGDFSKENLREAQDYCNFDFRDLVSDILVETSNENEINGALVLLLGKIGLQTTPQNLDAIKTLKVFGTGSCPFCGCHIGNGDICATIGHEDGDGYWTPQEYTIDHVTYCCPACGQEIDENELI